MNAPAPAVERGGSSPDTRSLRPDLRHVDHPRFHQQSRVRDDGHGRAHGAGPVLLCAAQGRGDARCQPAVRRGHHAVPGRGARGRRGRCHEAARIGVERGLRRQAHPVELAGGPERRVRRVSPRHRHRKGDPGRARQGGARPALVSSRREGPDRPARRHRELGAGRESRGALDHRRTCAISPRSPTRRSSRVSRTFRASPASTSTGGSHGRS